MSCTKWLFKGNQEPNQIVANGDSVPKIFARSRRKNDLNDFIWWKLGDG